MKLQQVIDQLNIKVLCGDKPDEREVNGGYVSDLLSDVMGNAGENNIWITMQTHKNIVAVAVLKDLAAIVLVNGNKADDETLFHAGNEDVTVLSTTDSAFEFTGKLYNLLLKNESL
ncbi:MAG: serine kinase [Bacteroidales bacterium]|nr:serine kinase [Bacteroidales bacterium]